MMPQYSQLLKPKTLAVIRDSCLSLILHISTFLPKHVNPTSLPLLYCYCNLTCWYLLASFLQELSNGPPKFMLHILDCRNGNDGALKHSCIMGRSEVTWVPGAGESVGGGQIGIRERAGGWPITGGIAGLSLFLSDMGATRSFWIEERHHITWYKRIGA